MARWIKMPPDTKVGLGPGHIVLHGDPAPPKGAHIQIFGSCLLWPNGRTSQLLHSTYSLLSTFINSLNKLNFRLYTKLDKSFFGQPFVKRFALCYWTVVCLYVSLSVLSVLSLCPVCPVCDVRALWPNGWTDQDETWRAGRHRPWPHCVRCGPCSPPQRGTAPLPNFWPISVAAKWLHRSRCHLIWK